jgi:hypothetical protein
MRHGRCRIRHRFCRQIRIHHRQPRSPLEIRHQRRPEFRIAGKPDLIRAVQQQVYRPPLRLRNIFSEVMRQHDRVPAAAHGVGLRSSQHLAQNPPRVADGPPACRQTEAAATRRRTLARRTSPSRRSAPPLHPATHTTRESDFLFRSRDSLSFLRLGTILPPSLPSSWDLASASLPGRLTGQAPFLRSLL